MVTRKVAPEIYFKEVDMPKSIRTSISVIELSWLGLFAKANALNSMRFGSWEDRVGWVINNKICYILLDPNENEEANLIYMSLKYGSFELAFDHFKKEVDKYK